MFPRLAPVLPAALLLAACYECDDDDYDPPPPSPPYYDLWEIEPNDAACCPDVIGDVWVDDAFVIGGTIRDDSYDPYDGFALANAEPLDVEFVLEPLDGYSDLDLCVWDPVVGDWAFCFDSPSSTETGRFSLPYSWTDFHLVVSSYDGDTEYRLHVYVQPITFGLDAPGGAGESKPGRAVPLAGYACEDAPPADDAGL